MPYRCRIHSDVNIFPLYSHSRRFGEALANWNKVALWKSGTSKKFQSKTKIWKLPLISSWIYECLRWFMQEDQPSKTELNYFSQLLYNGFYGFEALTDRNLDDVICGICGIVGELYLGDGNEKNCCSLREVRHCFTHNSNLASLADTLLIGGGVIDIASCFPSKSIKQGPFWFGKFQMWYRKANNFQVRLSQFPIMCSKFQLTLKAKCQ